MPTDSGTNDILSLGFLHYTTAVSREMSDEPQNPPPTSVYIMQPTHGNSQERDESNYKIKRKYKEWIAYAKADKGKEFSSCCAATECCKFLSKAFPPYSNSFPPQCTNFIDTLRQVKFTTTKDFVKFARPK